MCSTAMHAAHLACLISTSLFDALLFGLLQLGAQVMLLRNLELTGDERMLVNGSR